MRGFRDIHSHFVYGVDDGARERSEMEIMLDAAHKDRVVSLVATPHVTPGLSPFDEASFSRHFDEAREYCQSCGYEITLYAGAEILYTPAIQNYVSRHRLPTLGNSNAVLMEFVPDVSYTEMQEALELMERYGYLAILAHVERYKCLYHRKNIKRIKDNFDVRYQMNCRTVYGKNGFWQGYCIGKWLKEGYIDCVSSDAHNMTTRPFGMRRAYRALRESVGKAEARRMVGL